MTATYDDVRRLVRSGANVLHVASFEWERVRGWCIGLARDFKVPLEVWSSSTGLLAVGADGTCSPRDDVLTDPIEAMLRLRDAASGGVLLLKDVHPYFEPQHYQVARWVREMCRLEASPRRLLVLSTPLPGLPVELQKEVPTVELPLPGTDDLAVVADQVAERYGVAYDQDRTLLEAARGLTVMEARLAFGQAAQELDRLSAGAVPLVVREKERVIRQSQVLEYYEPDARMADVEFGGDDIEVSLDAYVDGLWETRSYPQQISASRSGAFISEPGRPLRGGGGVPLCPYERNSGGINSLESRVAIFERRRRRVYDLSAVKICSLVPTHAEGASRAFPIKSYQLRRSSGKPVST